MLCNGCAQPKVDTINSSEQGISNGMKLHCVTQAPTKTWIYHYADHGHYSVYLTSGGHIAAH